MAQWLVVISITCLAVISPGPDFAMVSRNSLLLSRRAGVLTALGIGCGVLIHVSYTLLGMALVMRHSPLLFAAMKLIGAAYLIWLGLKMLRARKQIGPELEPAQAPSDIAALRMGFLTNALNPKTTIFILSLFMQIVSPGTPITTQILYGLFIATAHVLWFSVVAIFFAAPPVRQTITAIRHWIDRVFGAALVGFGVALALTNLSR